MGSHTPLASVDGAAFTVDTISFWTPWPLTRRERHDLREYCGSLNVGPTPSECIKDGRRRTVMFGGTICRARYTINQPLLALVHKIIEFQRAGKAIFVNCIHLALDLESPLPRDLFAYLRHRITKRRHTGECTATFGSTEYVDRGRGAGIHPTVYIRDGRKWGGRKRLSANRRACVRVEQRFMGRDTIRQVLDVVNPIDLLRPGHLWKAFRARFILEELKPASIARQCLGMPKSKKKRDWKRDGFIVLRSLGLHSGTPVRNAKKRLDQEAWFRARSGVTRIDLTPLLDKWHNNYVRIFPFPPAATPPKLPRSARIRVHVHDDETEV